MREAGLAAGDGVTIRRVGDGELRAGDSALRLPDAIVLATALKLGGELMTLDQPLLKHAAALRWPT